MSKLWCFIIIFVISWLFSQPGSVVSQPIYSGDRMGVALPVAPQVPARPLNSVDINAAMGTPAGTAVVSIWGDELLGIPLGAPAPCPDIDAISMGCDSIWVTGGPPVPPSVFRVDFSVAMGAVGLPGTGVASLAGSAFQGGTIYSMYTSTFGTNSILMPATAFTLGMGEELDGFDWRGGTTGLPIAPPAGGNTHTRPTFFSQNGMCVPGFGAVIYMQPAGIFGLVPPIAMFGPAGTGAPGIIGGLVVADDIDALAYNAITGDLLFSLTPASPSAVALGGPGGVGYWNSVMGGPYIPWAPPAVFGLGPGDNLDALSILNPNVDGCYPYGDFDCSGILDVVDIIMYINQIFFGAPPPTDCCPP